ncbi:MAG: hypothetical protein IJC84_01835 [Clostridia bacterium]|nr:hypothetical protein [Clostridia bacterium]
MTKRLSEHDPAPNDVGEDLGFSFAFVYFRLKASFFNGESEKAGEKKKKNRFF